MKQYILKKVVVSAERMTDKEADAAGILLPWQVSKGKAKSGYRVKHEDDGREYWIPEVEFNKQYQIADSFQDRMQIELEELSGRIERLDGMINSERFGEFSEEVQKALDAQLTAMRMYEAALEHRMELLTDEEQQ